MNKEISEDGTALQAGSSLWCWFYDANGERQQRSTKCRDRKAAEEVARGFERAAADPNHEAKSATLSDALTLLIKHRTEQARAGRKSEATVELYRVKVGHLVRVFERDEEDRLVRFLAALKAASVDDYISRRRGEGHPTTGPRKSRSRIAEARASPVSMVRRARRTLPARLRTRIQTARPSPLAR